MFVLNRHVESVFDPSGHENLEAAEAGAGSMREDGNDVRFDANGSKRRAFGLPKFPAADRH